MGQLRQAEEPLAKLAANLEVFLDADAGGPLTCVPGRGSCEPCVGSAVDVELGVAATLAIEVRNISPVFASIASVVVADGSNGGFALLAPLPTEVAPAEAEGILVGITPTLGGVVTATFLLQTDAENMAGVAYPVTLRVNGVE